MSLKPIHDPQEQARLRQISERMAALLKEQDICGYLLLQGKNTCDFRMHLESSWSCLHFEPGADGAVVVRLRAARQSGADPELEKQRLNWTVGMLISTLDMFAAGQQMIGTCLAKFGPAIGEIEHINAPNPEPEPAERRQSLSMQAKNDALLAEFGRNVLALLNNAWGPELLGAMVNRAVALGVVKPADLGL